MSDKIRLLSINWTGVAKKGSTVAKPSPSKWTPTKDKKKPTLVATVVLGVYENDDVLQQCAAVALMPTNKVKKICKDPQHIRVTNSFPGGDPRAFLLAHDRVLMKEFKLQSATDREGEPNQATHTGIRALIEKTPSVEWAFNTVVGSTKELNIVLEQLEIMASSANMELRVEGDHDSVISNPVELATFMKEDGEKVALGLTGIWCKSHLPFINELGNWNDEDEGIKGEKFFEDQESGWRFGFNNNGENKVWAVPYQENLAERVKAALEELDVFGGHEEVTLA